MKLLITFIVLFFMALCYWVFSDESMYWKITRDRNGLLEKCIIGSCFFIAILFMIFVWLN